MTATKDYYDEPDPFEKVPSVSFAEAPVGTVVSGVVTQTAKLVQSRDYMTGEPATWPDGNPKMAAVLHLTVDGEERALWAGKPSALFNAIREAQQAVGSRIEVGDTVAVKFTGEKKDPDNPRKNPQKLYAVKITKAPKADAFADEAPF